MTTDTAVRAVDGEVTDASALRACDAGFPSIPEGLGIPSRAVLEDWFADRFIDPAVVEGISSLRELDSIVSLSDVGYDSLHVVVNTLLWGGDELLRAAKDDNGKTARLYYSVVTVAMQSAIRMDKDVDALEIGTVTALCQSLIPMNSVTVGELAFVVARERRWLLSHPMNNSLDGINRSVIMQDRADLVTRLRKVSRTGEALMWAVVLERSLDSDYLPEMDSAAVDSVLRLASLCSYDKAAPYIKAGVTDSEAVYRGVRDGIDVQLLTELSVGSV